MSDVTTGHLVLGLTHQGKKFRPSDWAERIASVFAHFDDRARLHFHPLVRPVVHDGMRCLFIGNELSSRDPCGFRFIMEFASGNDLQVVATGEPDHHYPGDELPHVA